jgi:hypothetical protein
MNGRASFSFVNQGIRINTGPSSTSPAATLFAVSVHISKLAGEPGIEEKEEKTL